MTRECGGFGHGDEGRAKAEAYARELVAAEQERTDRQRRLASGTVLVADLVRGWETTYGPLRSERTRITDRGRVERLATFFRASDARTLNHDDVTRFAAETMQERSASVAIGCLSTLRRCLNLAVKTGLLERNPVPNLNDVIRACRNRGRTEESRPLAWTQAEADQLLAIAWAPDRSKRKTVAKRRFAA